MLGVRERGVGHIEYRRSWALLQRSFKPPEFGLALKDVSLPRV